MGSLKAYLVYAMWAADEQVSVSSFSDEFGTSPASMMEGLIGLIRELWPGVHATDSASFDCATRPILFLSYG